MTWLIEKIPLSDWLGALTDLNPLKCDGMIESPYNYVMFTLWTQIAWQKMISNSIIRGRQKEKGKGKQKI